ncbi:Hint domain-containing protein [Acetobacter indonesiensis]|uniref:Hint domain-containing protein n=1 Tax=Acetobacter indonesiensis TaxID=104101 RepID=UPI0039E9A06B
MTTNVSSTVTVSSGVTSTGLNVTGTNDVWVQGGGTLTSSTIGTTGQFIIQANGVAKNITVTSANMAEDAGGVISSVYLYGSGNGQINGTAYDLVNAATVGGGALSINAGANVSGLYLSGGAINVNSGATISNFVISNNNTHSAAYAFAQISGGASVNGLSVTGWAQATVSQGATVSNVSLAVDGGFAATVIAESGATLVNATVASGTTLSGGSGVTLSGLITDRGTVSGGTLASGTKLDASTGSASDITIGSGASAFVDNGGDIRNTAVKSGGLLQAGQDGSYSGNTVVSAGGSVLNGEVKGTLVLSNGASATGLWVDAGGFVSANNVALSGITHARAGTVSGGVINSGATIAVDGSGVTSGLTVNSGGVETLADQGVSDSTTLNSGATLNGNGGTLTGTTTVNSGATLSATSSTIMSGSVNDAGKVIGGTVVAGANLNVLATGVASNTIASSGSIWVSGGKAFDITVTGSGAGGSATAGGVVSGLTLTSNGQYIAAQGGTVNGGTVSGPQAYLFASSGGTVNGLTVSSSGQIIVDSGSVVTSNTVGNGGHYFVLGGTLDSSTTNVFTSGADIKITSNSTLGTHGAVNNFTVNSGVALRIQDSATGSNVTVGNGGTERVFDGGTTTNGTILSGGTLTVSANGAAVSTLVQSGGQLLASAGSVAGNTTVNSGGLLSASSTVGLSGTITDNGTVSGGIVVSGAQLNVGSTGVAANVNVSGGSAVLNGGKGYGLVVQSGSATIWAQSGAVVSGTLVTNDGNLTVQEGATAFGTILSGTNVVVTSGVSNVHEGLVIGSGGVTHDTVLANIGAFTWVCSNGAEYNTIVNSGATDNLVGGSSFGTQINSGAFQAVLSGSVASGTIVSSGATLNADNGTVIGSTVYSGGVMSMTGNSNASDLTVYGNTSVTSLPSDGGLFVSGGTVTDTTLKGYAEVLDGSISNTVVASTGALDLGPIWNSAVSGYNGTESGSNLSAVSGGIIYVNSGATLTSASASGSYTFGDGSAYSAEIAVRSGGDASHLSFGSGGFLEITGGKLDTATFASGASALVAGGALSNAVFSAGATADVYANTLNNTDKFLSGATVNVHGSEYTGSPVDRYSWDKTFPGGVVSGISIDSGATLNVLSGGKSISAVISGTENVLSGGSATGSIVSGTMNISGGAIVSNTVVTNGGVDYVLSGATVTGTQLLANGLEHVASGGVSIGTVATGSGAHIWTDTGAVTSNAVISDSATQGVGEGAAYNTTVNSGGRMSVASNATAGSAFNTVINNGGDIEIAQGAVVSNTTVNSGGLATVFANAVITDVTVNNGGSANIAQNGTLSGTMKLADGGRATIWANAGGTIVMDGSTNTGLVVSGLASGGTLTTTINGFNGTAAGNSDGIEIDGVKASDVTKVEYTDADNVKLTLKNGGIINMHIPGAEAAGYSLQTAKDGDLLFEVCFLAGSMIATPDADVAVETLEIGDVVKTWNWQSQSVENRTIVWVGKKHMTVKAGVADDAAGYPVRVLKNAIAEGVPYKDMLITPEHSLFFENKFVPVRMLVNGRSIFYDRSIQSYDYFHVETEDHSVIWGDGMMTESYLDTGNRSTFRQEGAVVRLGQAEGKDWASDAAAELAVSRAVVEPLFRQIETRAADAGLADQSDVAELTHDADLHLVTDKGHTVRAARKQGDLVTFMLPVGVESVRVVSRTSRPSDAIGPFVDDRRDLGVLVGDVSLFDGAAFQNLTSHLDQADLDGWDVVEASACRWTNGNALLPLGAAENANFRLLTLKILAAGPYRLTAENTVDLVMVG